MKRVAIDYLVLGEHGQSLSEFERVVLKHLLRGYELVGGPWHDPQRGCMRQAVVEYQDSEPATQHVQD
ncbi:hypothetical protein BcepSauron_367 [Burkholderia phage BcepSauron]|uniref:Uncharacterized protein n=2 Tax=Sarumanvirus TaxID=2843450 RepID=A0A482ML39_9CAUD|nr:hypothetical protein H1O16_gp364 [Burkholderia phage BcepSaruman]YP_009904745.1 hypothetical protein H1O17_gp367 [Burkholderia phage BcepSauron]QBQ74747.1 hypothetical protein BcepSauron_367 [Burkholderia phage BcepSauron]QBX06777.1 hypothetical protein BcepSaruman_364 [Burkholderia phage BcepSaruman]